MITILLFVVGKRERERLAVYEELYDDKEEGASNNAG